MADGKENEAESGARDERKKSQRSDEVHLERKDYLALAIASLETYLLPLVILTAILVVLLFVVATVLR